MQFRIALLLAFVIAAVPRAGAQSAAPDTAARQAAMQKLAFLVGRWSGPAHATVGRGEQLEMIQTEYVHYSIGGQVLVVEGTGRRAVSGAAADTVFQAFGTIDWTPERGYLMRSYVRSGYVGEYALTVTPDGFAWGMPVPGGRIEYVMVHTPAGEWSERGQFIMESGARVPTMAMKLTAVIN